MVFGVFWCHSWWFLVAFGGFDCFLVVLFAEIKLTLLNSAFPISKQWVQSGMVGRCNEASPSPLQDRWYLQLLLIGQRYAPTNMEVYEDTLALKDSFS